MPTRPYLEPLVAAPGLELVDGLTDAREDAPAPRDDPPAPCSPWTYRYEESGVPARDSRFDQVWLSPALARVQDGAGINRRRRLTKDGSDHDAAWVQLVL